MSLTPKGIDRLGKAPEARTEAAASILPRWKCHKVVTAAKIITVVHGGGEIPYLRLESGEPAGAIMCVDDAWIEKHDPQPGGYLVQHEDGHITYTPAKAFEAGYSRI